MIRVRVTCSSREDRDMKRAEDLDVFKLQLVKSGKASVIS